MILQTYEITELLDDKIKIVATTGEYTETDIAVDHVYNPMGKIKLEVGMVAILTDNNWIIPLRLFESGEFYDLLSNGASLVDIIEKFLDICETFSKMYGDLFKNNIFVDGSLSVTVPPATAPIPVLGAFSVFPNSGGNAVDPIEAQNKLTAIRETIKKYKGEK